MDRERLTITLRKDVLKRLDKTIDGNRIRNRSHAIEYHLNQSLPPSIDKALILAGGRGVNMRPFTYEMPKTMIPIKDKPILEYTIEHLRDAGIRELIINIGHLGEKIEKHFGDGKKYGVHIEYIREKKEQGTAGALRLAKEKIKGKPFLLMYGDVLAEIDINDFIDFHVRNWHFATFNVADSAVSVGATWLVLRLLYESIVG